MTDNQKLSEAITKAIDAMPGEEILNVMATHAQHRVVVHFKFRDRLEDLLDTIEASYSKFPAEVRADLSHKTRLVLAGYEELGECLVEMGQDTDLLGQNLITALQALEEGLDD